MRFSFITILCVFLGLFGLALSRKTIKNCFKCKSIKHQKECSDARICIWNHVNQNCEYKVKCHKITNKIPCNKKVKQCKWDDTRNKCTYKDR